MNQNTSVTAWAVDAFAMIDVWGFNFVAYGYTGKGVGTTGLFFDGVDIFGNARPSDGGYLQAAYTFKGGWLLPNPLTVGASWGVSSLETAGGEQFVRDPELPGFAANGTTAFVGVPRPAWLSTTNPGSASPATTSPSG